MSWSIEKAKALYHIDAWSEGYVTINKEGLLCITPSKNNSDSKINLYDLVDKLKQESLTLPVLVRFSDILKDRVSTLINAFDEAINHHQYTGSYTAVYPIKVNQQRRVIEDIVSVGKNRTGLESGSKPELLINIAMANAGSRLICNGYKDREYIYLALIAKQIGFDSCIVIEKLSELRLIVECAEETGITPTLGIRIRLSSIASGKWQNTGGDKSKFGLHANQILTAIKILREHELLPNLELLHFHIGSQIANLDDLKRGLLEGARYYAEFKHLDIPIKTIDIGGGLGVDYEGTQSTREYSINYTMNDYANVVIEIISHVCKAESITMPDIITESGRAMTAHHAMLITNISDVESSIAKPFNKTNTLPESEISNDFLELLNQIPQQSVEDAFKKNESLFILAKKMFTDGEIDIEQWALIEELYNAVFYRLHEQIDVNHPLIETLREKLAAKYFANFSLFQTMPDTWAIDQIFPIVPLQRLTEKPSVRCTLQDLTCDSDGRIDYYVDGEGIETSLPIHDLESNEKYLIGIFLLGAYQEILGDIHNLFGDTASVNVSLSDTNEIELSEMDNGDKVSDLFQGIHISTDRIKQRFQKLISESKLNHDHKTEYLEQLIHGLEGYTYLEA